MIRHHDQGYLFNLEVLGTHHSRSLGSMTAITGSMIQSRYSAGAIAESLYLNYKLETGVTVGGVEERTGNDMDF